MINWMQKHKKYLVVTIWISTIAFVGAGFVGWGAYSFSSASSAVAVVGETKITATELGQEYARLYELYNRLVGGSLDQEQAKELGLEEQALESLISKTLMLNFARDTGLRVSDDEVARAIVGMDTFQLEGKFDEATYRRALEQNHYKPADFERALGDSLLLEKLGIFLNPPVSALEQEALGASFYLQDKLAIKILDSSSIAPQVSEEEVQKFWSENQNAYMTDRRYEIIYTLTKSSDTTATEEDLRAHYESAKSNYLGLDGQILSFDLVRARVENEYRESQAEKAALKSYLELKKSENPEGIRLSLAQSDMALGDEILLRLSEAKAGETLKPLPVPGGYAAVKLLDVIESQPMSFEEAKESAREGLLAKKKLEILEANAKAELPTFKGEVVGFVSRDDVAKIPLPTEESAEFLMQVFQSRDSKGYAILGEKAVLFEILAQRLPPQEETPKNLDFIAQSIAQIKERLAENALLEELQRRYPIIRNR